MTLLACFNLVALWIAIPAFLAGVATAGWAWWH